MRSARATITLEELGIPDVRAKRAITGALLLEISGKGCEEKADQLFARMIEVLKEEEVRVARPVRRTDVTGRLGHCGRGRLGDRKGEGGGMYGE